MKDHRIFHAVPLQGQTKKKYVEWFFLGDSDDTTLKQT